MQNHSKNSVVRIPRIRLAFAMAFAIAFAISIAGADDLHAQHRNGDGEFPSMMTFETGYVFVDGEYVTPPYKLELTDNVLRINETEYDEAAFDLSVYASRRRGEGGRVNGGYGEGRGEGRRGGGGRGSRGGKSISPLHRVYRSMEALTDGAVVLLDSEREPEFLYSKQRGQDFLDFLLKTVEGNQIVELPECAGDETDREQWRQVAAAFRPTPEFLKRAKHQVDELNAAGDAAESEVAAMKLSRRINYPLTMFALVLVVFAVGHLMTIAQPTFSATPDAEAGEKITSLAMRSLAIIALLSVIDLVWTILAHQSGSMRELNPIGGKLISDPFQLLVFKVSLTGFAIILLFRYRQLPLSRKATWWCCLVLTLLTVRWLTFHSMFA